jgi:site-specific DNA recombinase
VIVYHLDRLTRRPVELEHFVEVIERAGPLPVKFVSGGGGDIGTGDGLLVVRMLAAVAANESASKSRRVRRKMEANALAGLPHGGATRPFGYEPDFVTIREDEARIVRDLVERFLAGDSMRSLVSWLDENEVPTVTGAPWRATTLRPILASPRIAGLRSSPRQPTVQATWPGIITVDQHERILALLAQRKVSGRRAPQSYVLTGLLRCGKCGKNLYASARKDTRRYVCMSGPDHRGCGGITITADPLERFLEEAVLQRLDSPALAAALAGRAESDEQAAALAANLAADQERLDELATMYAAGDISRREWMTARSSIEARRSATERSLNRTLRTDNLTGLIGNGSALRATWTTLNLPRQHAIISAVLAHAVIHPARPEIRRFDHNRIEPAWRL